MKDKIRVGVIGFGRMGEYYVEDMTSSGRWDIRYICDSSPSARELAGYACPGAEIISD